MSDMELLAVRLWLQATLRITAQAAWGWLRVQGFRVKVQARRHAARFAKRHIRRMERSKVRRLVLLACLFWLAHVMLSHPAAAELATAVTGMTGMACARLAPHKKVPDQRRRLLLGTRYPKQMGRPRLDDAKRVHIPLKVSEQMAERIDTARGSASRADWIRGLIEAALTGGSPLAKRPRAADEDPDLIKKIIAGSGDHAGHRVSPAWGTSKSGRYYCDTCRAWVTGPLKGR